MKVVLAGMLMVSRRVSGARAGLAATHSYQELCMAGL